jgi:hypothetical protein
MLGRWLHLRHDQDSIRCAALLRWKAAMTSRYEGEPHYYYDVDTPEYLARLKEELEANPRAAPPHTAKF